MDLITSVPEFTRLLSITTINQCLCYYTVSTTEVTSYLLKLSSCEKNGCIFSKHVNSALNSLDQYSYQCKAASHRNRTFLLEQSTTRPDNHLENDSNLMPLQLIHLDIVNYHDMTHVHPENLPSSSDSIGQILLRLIYQYNLWGPSNRYLHIKSNMKFIEK